MSERFGDPPSDAEWIRTLERQRDELLAAIEAVRSAPSEAASYQPEADLYKLASSIRGGDGG